MAPEDEKKGLMGWLGSAATIAKDAASAVQTAVAVVVVIVTIRLVLPVIPKVNEYLQKATVAEVELLGLKLKLSDSLNTPSRTEGKVEQRTLPGPDRAAATVLDTSGFFWVFLGTTQRGSRTQLTTANFEVEKVPDSGTSMLSVNGTYKRDNPPRTTNGKWRKGSIVGVVNAGDSVEVREMDSVPGDNNTTDWWSRVLAPKTGRSLNVLRRTVKPPAKK